MTSVEDCEDCENCRESRLVTSEHRWAWQLWCDVHTNGEAVPESGD